MVTPMAIFDVDEFSSWLKDFYEGLLAGSRPYGSFLWGRQPVPNLLYINDVVWMRWLRDDLALSDVQRAGLIESINDCQYPEGGFYHNPVFENHTWQHATWRAMVSLNMLGGKTRYPLAFLEALKDVKTCEAWLGSHDAARNEIAHHRYALGAFVMGSGVGAPWREAFFSGVDALQRERSGFWAKAPTGERREESLSPTFLFSVLHLAFGREIPRGERVLDTVLSYQRENGNFSSGDGPAFCDMDALFLLQSISGTLGTRRDEVLAAMRKSARALRGYWDGARDRVFLANPHNTLAICGMLSVLKDAIPDEVRGNRPFRFPYAAGEFLRPPESGAGR